jgi:diguanylate cyclase (GGDEF)-like protein
MQSSDRNLAFSLVQDVTERQELHQRLLHQANHDLLTGLANRACLEDRLRAALTQTSRIPTQSALLCLDLDRFKQVNDTYGHSVGDICLQQIAQRLKSLVSGQDLAARVGGEEFSLLLHNISSVRQAEHVASDVLLALQAPIHANGYTLDLTASIGIAIFPDDGHDPATLWRNADDAMYRAKRAGGNQFRCMSPEISRLSSEDNAMELQVRRALRYGGLEVYYQPLYKITGELHSLEALVRLNHPELGITLPNRFVPIAEERGLIVPLGSWVINEVCRQMHAWRAEGLPPVHVALNISPLQITRPDFAAQLAATLETHQIDPHWIGIEITETAMMRNLGEAARQIQLLADMGISFSVDDFGTGYSSFGQLDKLPVQRLKTDRSFIDRLCRSDGTYSIVDAIISMAHTLRLQVVAEGVESHEQWECLRQLNCDIVQGFLFSEPLPAAKLSSLIRRGASPRPPSLEPLLI